MCSSAVKYVILAVSMEYCRRDSEAEVKSSNGLLLKLHLLHACSKFKFFFPPQQESHQQFFSSSSWGVMSDR